MDGFVLDRALMSASEQERLMLGKALSSATGDSAALFRKLGALFRAPDWLSDWLRSIRRRRDTRLR